MLKQTIIALSVVITLMLAGSVKAQPVNLKETVDEVAVAKAKAIRAEAEKLKASAKADKRKIDALLVKAADMETNAHKLGKKCMHGSHQNIATVKKNHRNCEACHVVEIKDGECARVPGDHEHYYCYCDC
ncbi:MAG: hypothetical protein II938_02035 [Alphaproteobacteria bacterium]|nr:hypothetical protein [Alphaproteobacteria bacterium]